MKFTLLVGKLLSTAYPTLETVHSKLVELDNQILTRAQDIVSTRGYAYGLLLSKTRKYTLDEAKELAWKELGIEKQDRYGALKLKSQKLAKYIRALELVDRYSKVEITLEEFDLLGVDS